MSAEVLRQAAREMRHDSFNGEAKEAPFLEAVSDWLEATAVRVDYGKRGNHSWRGSREALTVARAYLGSDQ